MIRHLHRASWTFATCAAVVSLPPRAHQRAIPSPSRPSRQATPDIFIAAGDGSNAGPLAPDPALDYNAAFSADGSWILFTSHRAGSADLYRIRPDGTGLERLTDDPAFADRAHSRPTANASRSCRPAAARRTSGRSTRTRASPTSHRRPRRGLPSHVVAGRSWIAFVSDRQPAARSCPSTTEPGPGAFVTPQYTSLFVARADGSDVRRITSESETAGGPRWSTDGSRLIAYAAAIDAVCRGDLMFALGPSQIVSIDWRTGHREPITEGPGLKVFPSWLPDGRAAYVTGAGLAFTDGRREVAGEFGRPDWNTAGSMMVFHRERIWPPTRIAPSSRRTARTRGSLFCRLSGHASFAPAGDRLSSALQLCRRSTQRPARRRADRRWKRRTVYEGPVTDDLAGPAWSPRGDRFCSDSADSSSALDSKRPPDDDRADGRGSRRLRRFGTPACRVGRRTASSRLSGRQWLDAGPADSGRRLESDPCPGDGFEL